MVTISRVKIKYTGTLISYTNKMNEELEFKEEATLDEVLARVEDKYGTKMLRDIKNNFNIILSQEQRKGILVDKSKMSDYKLGANNSLAFFYPFTGG